MNTLILEGEDENENAIDVYERLSKSNIIFLSGYISQSLATDVCATLLMKSSMDQQNTITLFINCLGAESRHVFMIYDMMSNLPNPICTWCIGNAEGSAALLLAAGTPGKRFATKNSFICPGPISYGLKNVNNMVELDVITKFMKTDNEYLMTALAKHTKKSVKKVTKDFENKRYFTAEQALEYSIIDKVIEKAGKK